MSRNSERRSLRQLRTLGELVMLAGAAASIGLLFHASQRRPPLLMVIFVIWVLSPFMILLFVDKLSKGWSNLTRATLYSLMIVVPLASLAIYFYDAERPRLAQAAFVYVIVPPASCLLMAIVVPAAALLGRRFSHHGDR